jgi:hypothetical protein
LPAHIMRFIVARLRPENSCARLIVMVRGALALFVLGDGRVIEMHCEPPSNLMAYSVSG